MGRTGVDALAHVADVPKQAVQDAGRNVLDFFRVRKLKDDVEERAK